MKITKIIRPIHIGITNPHIVECDNGKKYYAKFPGNPDGSRVLINEYICAELAKLFKLPIPNYSLVEIDNINEFEGQLNNINMINGTAFCSEEIEKAIPIPNYTALMLTSNPVDAIKTLIFDVIIGNNDRNQGNILLNVKNKSYVIIDHSHVFLDGALWNIQNLQRAIENPISVDKLNQKTFNTLVMANNNRTNKRIIEEYKETIKNIKEEDINKILKGIPVDWEITEKEKNILKEFILNRINRIEEIYRLLNIGGD